MKVSTIQKIFLIIALTFSQLIFADDLKDKDSGAKSLINIEEFILAKDYSSAISLCLSLHRSDPNSVIYLNKLYCTIHLIADIPSFHVIFLPSLYFRP